MAIIPNDEQFIGISSDVDMSEKKSSQVNSKTQVYTLQDFSDSLTPDLTPITVDGNSVSIAKDPTATTQDTAVIQSSDTNAGIAIVPNGTGAITANIPDGTVTGGNARGQYAVDLQMDRNTALRVASGDYSTIVGGRYNTSAGTLSVTGGYRNTANGQANVAMGYQNTTSNAYTTAFGAQNNSSSNYSTISGGQSNTAGTGTHATVVGGKDNTSSGQYSCSGGNGSIASGQNSFSFGTISGGNANSATGGGSVAMGNGNRALATGAVAMGTQSYVTGIDAIGIGRQARAEGDFSVAFSKNSAASNYSTVSGGESNFASTGTHATVVGGKDNTSSGQYSVSGGLDNTASGSRSTALGFDNVSSGSYSFAGGRANDVSGESSAALGEEVDITANYSFGVGRSNTVASQYSAVFGRGVKSYLYNSNIRGGQIFASRGDCQATELVANKSDDLTTGGTTVLSLDGTGTTNLIIPDGNNRAWNVTIKTIAIVESITGTATGITVGDSWLENASLLFKKVGGTSSVVGSVSVDNTINDTSLSACDMEYTAGTSEELKLTFTAPTFSGGGSVTMRVVSKVELTEVAF